MVPNPESSSESAMNTAPQWEKVRCSSAYHPPRPAQSTRVVLVRHGETDWNAAGVYQGWKDVPLNARGMSQALELGEQLTGISISAAYTSPLSRAVMTAELILGSGTRAVNTLSIAAIRELSYGDLEGLPPQQRRASWPQLEAQWATDPWDVRFPEGESLDMLATRALPVWERLLTRHAGQTILLSGHGHLNRVILLHARSLPRSHFWTVEQGNGSATMLECLPPARLARSNK